MEKNVNSTLIFTISGFVCMVPISPALETAAYCNFVQTNFGTTEKSRVVTIHNTTEDAYEEIIVIIASTHEQTCIF